MSDSLSPWLCEHIVSIAETYGAQLASIPFTDSKKKKKKVQIKEASTLTNSLLIPVHSSPQFLTFPPQGQEETYVWAIISDKQHTIPVKFTREAMTDYYQQRRVQRTTFST